MSDSTKFCRYCGARIPVDSEFCEKCGKVLTPEKEIVKVSQPEAIRKSRTGKLLLAIIVIALALTSAFVLSVAPNPLVKNRPWVSVENISFSVSWEIEGTTVYSFLIITIHNPTHRTHTIELRDAELDVNISSPLYPLPRTFQLGPATNFQIFEGGNWTKRKHLGQFLGHSVELPACSPIVVGFDFDSNEPTFPVKFNNEMAFHLNLVFTLNGVPTTFTDDWTENLVVTLLQTTTTTTTTTTGVYTPPNECLLPWV